MVFVRRAPCISIVLSTIGARARTLTIPGRGTFENVHSRLEGEKNSERPYLSPSEIESHSAWPCGDCSRRARSSAATSAFLKRPVACLRNGCPTIAQFMAPSRKRASSRTPPNFGENRPEFGRSNLARTWSKPARVWPRSAQICPTPTKFRRTRPKLARSRSKPVQLWPRSAPSFSRSGSNCRLRWRDCGQDRPKARSSLA